jgi:acyl-CoA thioester hydrolase
MATDDRSEIQSRSRWGEIDSNGHMRNVAYLDISANSRMEFFNANGYTLTEFFGAGLGPVVLKDEIEYKREVRLGEDLTVTNELAGMSEDSTRFIFRNQFIKANGKLACKISSLVAFFDIATRKTIAPPENLMRAILSLPRSEDFGTITQ